MRGVALPGFPEEAAAQPRPISRQGLADEVYDAIFNLLMSLRIAPGERITVDNLVRDFQVSHTPIREALGRLEGEGLVVKTHLVGYRAAPQISRRRFEELYELRLLLEPDAARRAALAMTPQALRSLETIAQAMSEVDGGDARARYAAFARQDAIFHDSILELSGNALVRATLAHQHTHFHIFRLMFHTSVTEQALDEHTAILAAFRAGDGGLAEAAMRTHILRSRDRLLPGFG
ncbi:MAG: GntR family transcriptional regulator [Rhizobiaceae bacterium]|nr:GntR family transcriptional regulator [Rhizobiaceae bacterium]